MGRESFRPRPHSFCVLQSKPYVIAVIICLYGTEGPASVFWHQEGTVLPATTQKRIEISSKSKSKSIAVRVCRNTFITGVSVNHVGLEL